MDTQNRRPLRVATRDVDAGGETALLDRLLHHAHVLKCGPRSWRTKLHGDLRPGESVR